MNITFETEQENDGSWLAEVPKLPGVLAYGSKAEALALCIEHGEVSSTAR
jgi:predicted RNase H-like HicB family nuclease